MGIAVGSVAVGRMCRPGADGESRDCGSGRRCADDAGFTPAEIIIGVILVGILATGVTIKAIQLMDRARDSAAQKTLRAADVAAQAAFSVMLPGGQSNYASTALKTTGTLDGTAVTNVYTDAAANLVISAIQDQEPGLSLKSFGTTANKLKTMRADGQVWVEANNATLKNGADASFSGSANPNGHSARTTTVKNGVSIRAGEMIRMGIVAASGSTFCVISVADSSDGSISGDGWQAVDELLTLSGTNGSGADCGADVSTTGTANAEFYEMPGTPGTDPNLSQPVSNLTGNKTGQYVNTGVTPPGQTPPPPTT